MKKQDILQLYLKERMLNAFHFRQQGNAVLLKVLTLVHYPQSCKNHYTSVH